MPLSSPAPVLTGVAWSHVDFEQQGQQLASTLALTALGIGEPRRMPEGQLVLWVTERGLALQASGRNAPGPVRVDFSAGRSRFRRLHGGGRGQPVARAVGLRPGKQPPSVLDATAGLGQDAFVLACLGCQVRMIERSPLIWALLQDGLRRAGEDPVLAPIVARMELHCGQAGELLKAPGWASDVIYLDPMFPHRNSAAQARKEMQLFRELLGTDDDADHLLAPALAKARYRVVVKRPRLAPPLADTEPDHQLTGKSNRFDLYTRQRLP